MDVVDGVANADVVVVVVVVVVVAAKGRFSLDSATVGVLYGLIRSHASQIIFQNGFCNVQ